MIDVRPGRAGLQPLADVLNAHGSSGDGAGGGVAGQRTVTVVVPTPAARIAAETMVLRGVTQDGTIRPDQRTDVRVVTPVDLARSVLTAARVAVPDLVGSAERRRHLQRYLHRSFHRNAQAAALFPGTDALTHLIPELAALRENQPIADELVTDIGRAFDDARLASAGAAEISVHASATEADQWLLVAALLDGWSAHLAQAGITDRVGLLTLAMTHARQPQTVQAWWRGAINDGTLSPEAPGHHHLVVADADRLPAPTVRMLTSLLGPSRPDATSATLWGMRVPIRTTAPTASSVAPRHAEHTAALRPFESPRLVRCGHPALEAEAAVGELVAAHEAGTNWSDMVVVATNHDRLRAVARAARRAEIPITGAPPPRLEGPVVAAVMQRANEVSTEITPVALMRSVLQERSHVLSSGSVEAETLISLAAHAARHGHLDCHRWAELISTAPPAPAFPPDVATDAVSLCTIDNLLDRADPPRFTVLLGCVEGTIPSRRRVPRFDPAVLDGPGGLDAADHDHLDAERLRFASITAATAPEGQVVYVAAPEPGVLVSRFAEGIPVEAPRFAPRSLDPERWPIGLAPTVNARPLTNGRSLHLSASQINLYDNCPWQHTVQYRLNLRTEGGLQARFGTYIHTVLERFVAGIGSARVQTAAADPPTIPNPYGSTLDGLLALADECWTDDITDYAPQEDDYRGRANRMLTDWWHRDGQALVTDGRAAFLEYRFEVSVGDHTVTGFIDRIDRVVDADGQHGLAIIDYKTAATAKTGAETDEDLQLAVYHLAANLDPTLHALGPVVSLNLDFLAGNKQVGQQITVDHLERTTTRITEVAQRMLDEDAQPSVDASCDYCDLARLCDLQAEGRAVPVKFGPRP